MSTSTAATGSGAVYRAGTGRKIALTVVLLLLLPFFVSLPMMILWRFREGQVTSAAILTVVAVLFALCLLFLLVTAIYSYRTRITVDDTALRYRGPTWTGGPTPGLRYVDRTIPLDRVGRLETRGEIYRAMAVPSLMTAARVVTKDGETLHLGYQHQTSEDPAFPIDDILAEISRRSGVPVTEAPGVRVASQTSAMLRGLPPWSEVEYLSEEQRQATADQYRRMRRKNHALMFTLAFVVIGLAAIAFVVEMGKSGLFNSPG